MQPYFLPYIGYFQLIHNADTFVIYDNIKYTKKGWINRNRILVNGVDEYISLPLKKDSDYLNVNERYLSDSWHIDRNKLLIKVKECYRKAPYYNTVYELFNEIISSEEKNLFTYILNSLLRINNYLNIDTPIVISSSLDIDHNLKGEDKVIAICKSLNASEYINPIGGTELYQKEMFASYQLKLKFLKSNPIAYQQFNDPFVPWLSMLDILMFNDAETIKRFLDKEFTLMENVDHEI